MRMIDNDMLGKITVMAAELRAAIRNGREDVSSAVGREAVDNLMNSLVEFDQAAEIAMLPSTIWEFDGEHAFLSNFFPQPIKLWGKRWPTSEHAYQAAKTLDAGEREKIRLAGTPGKSKRMGRHIALRPDWESVKVGIMREVLRAKFAVPDMRDRLLATGSARLVEGNTWNDRIWGMVQGRDGSWQGQNLLGKLLMEIRTELRKDRG